MNDIEGLSIPHSESDVPVEVNTTTSKGYVGVKQRLLTSKRLIAFGVCTSLLLVVYDGTLSDKLTIALELSESLDLHDKPIRLNYTFYGEEKPQLECFDTKGQ